MLTCIAIWQANAQAVVPPSVVPPLPAETESSKAVASKDYRLGPGDQVTITVTFADELNNKPFLIDSAGDINIAFAGRVHAAGLTVEELETAIASKLTPFFRDPAVLVNVSQFGSHPVSVLGEVHNPAVHQLHGRTTLVEMLSASGGLTQMAGSKLMITRSVAEGPLKLSDAHLDASGKFTTGEVDLAGLLAGKAAENILVEPNDTITVPRAKLIYVLGEVHKPGGFPLYDTETASILQAVALAEGPLPTANIEHVRILRARSGDTRDEIPVNVKKILDHEQADVYLHPDDVLYFPNSKAKSAALRGLETAIQMGTGLVVWGRF